MKLFVAVYPPAAARAHLQAAVDRLHLGAATAAGQRVGLVPPERWHLTVAFLGQVPPEQAAAAADAVRVGVDHSGPAPAAGAAATAAAPELRLAGGGTFGRGRYTVLWVGLDGDVDRLRGIATAVRRALRRTDLPVDDRRPFRAHLTIARPGGRIPDTALAADRASLDDYRGPPWRMADVYLVHSRPGPRPVYETVATVPLTTAAG